MGNTLGCYKSVKDSEITPDSIDTPTSDEVQSIVLSTDPSLLCDRIPYGAQALKFKREALERNPGLNLFKSNDSFGREFLRIGMNALRAQILDLNMFCDTMKVHRTRLTYDHLSSFFNWLGPTLTYVENYFYMEEDVIFSLFENRDIPVRAGMSPAKRVLLRGQLRKSLHDLFDTQLFFEENQAIGEKFQLIPPLVDHLTGLAIEYTSKFIDALVPLFDEHFSRAEIEQIHSSVIRYIIDHEDPEDNLVMYTIWMNPSELKRWKRKHRSALYRINKMYKFWEKRLYNEHFKIAALFADELYCEPVKDDEQVKAEKLDSNCSRVTPHHDSENEGSLGSSK